LAHLGLSIEDSKYFDLTTYFELVQLEMKVISGVDGAKRASQADIDRFLI
jgi:hypothetical protein